jgi:hypothetical protein
LRLIPSKKNRSARAPHLLDAPVPVDQKFHAMQILRFVNHARNPGATPWQSAGTNARAPAFILGSA